METDIIPFCGSIKKRWSRRRYDRLKNVVTNEEHMKIARSEASKYAKIRLPPNMISSSIKFLKRFRDAYVEMMLCFAGRIAQLNNGNVYLYKRIPNAPRFSASQEVSF